MVGEEAEVGKIPDIGGRDFAREEEVGIVRREVGVLEVVG